MPTDFLAETLSVGKSNCSKDHFLFELTPQFSHNLKISTPSVSKMPELPSLNSLKQIDTSHSLKKIDTADSSKKMDTSHSLKQIDTSHSSKQIDTSKSEQINIREAEAISNEFSRKFNSIGEAMNLCNVCSDSSRGIGINPLLGAALIEISSINSYTGAVVMHEYSHALAYKALLANSNPTVQADVIDNLRSGNLVYVFSYKDVGGLNGFSDGNDGYCRANWDSSDGYTKVGNILGTDGTFAVIYLAGSVPVVALSSILTGFAGFKRSVSLLTAGIVTNAGTCSYALSATTMSSEQMKHSACKGHDFANAAMYLSNATGISAHTFAQIDAAAIISIPIMAAFMGYMVGGENKADSLIIQKLLAKSALMTKDNKYKSAFEAIASKYEGFDKLSEEAKIYKRDAVNKLKSLVVANTREQKNQILSDLKRIQKNWEGQQLKFEKHIAKNLPKEIRKSLKAEVNKELGLEETEGQKIVRRIGYAGAFGMSVAYFLSALGKYLVPVLAPLSYAMTIVCPILSGIGFLANIQQLREDLKNPLIPKSAKFVSAMATITIGITCTVGVICLAVPTLIPFGFSAGIVTGLFSMALQIYRRKLIIDRFNDIDNSVNVINWNKNFNNCVHYINSNGQHGLSYSETIELSKWLKMLRLGMMGKRIPADIYVRLQHFIGPNKIKTEEDLISYLKGTESGIRNEIKKQPLSLKMQYIKSKVMGKLEEFYSRPIDMFCEAKNYLFRKTIKGKT